ncbi:hypothetical protein [Streptomyces sp. NPDC058108]|uniref:hypothetical protein n=1 Tax=Streptomyces sp. NPDC058108 TaxID=3346344 RepID=UPI0036EFD39B
MTTMHAGEGQDVPELSILNSSIDELLAQAEHQLVRQQREVQALRRRARRQRRRALHAQAKKFIGKALPVGLACIGTAAFITSVVLMAAGNFGTAKDLLTLAAAAWAGVPAVRFLRF